MYELPKRMFGNNNTWNNSSLLDPDPVHSVHFERTTRNQESESCRFSNPVAIISLQVKHDIEHNNCFFCGSPEKLYNGLTLQWISLKKWDA